MLNSNNDIETWKKNLKESYYKYIEDLNGKKLKIQVLKKIGEESESKKSRYCFHENEKSKTQLMLIYHGKGAVVELHKHEENGEFILIEEGECTVIYEKHNKKISQKLNVDNPLIWIDKEINHKLIVDSDYIIFYEFKRG